MGKNSLTSELDRIQWVENLPGGCDVELEVCVADDYAEFEDFVSPPAWFGPTGGGNFTTPAGQALPSGKTGRYAMVRATLTGNGSATPTLSDIQLTCNAGSDTGSRVIRTRYDEAGNILRITTIDDLGVSEDVRDDAGWSSGDRINTLNQIMRQDVGGDTWTFTWDDNGNLTEKTNDVDTWIYTWDTLQGNRLVRVQGPGSVDVAYSYDSAGRMVSRDDGGPDITYLTWDGFNCIRETTGLSTTTYCIPEGVLTSFIRNGDRFDVHTDHVMSVRMVTDDSGDVVLRREFSAFGSELAGNFDNVPGGFTYGFVGAAGCIQDPTSELVYMRQRWYDPTLQRFISRDQLMGDNRYAYADNSPSNLVDTNGLRPESPHHAPGYDDLGGGYYRYKDDGHNGYTNDPRWIPTRRKGRLDPIPVPIDTPPQPTKCETEDDFYKRWKKWLLDHLPDWNDWWPDFPPLRFPKFPPLPDWPKFPEPPDPLGPDAPLPPQPKPKSEVEQIHEDNANRLKRDMEQDKVNEDNPLWRYYKYKQGQRNTPF